MFHLRYSSQYHSPSCVVSELVFLFLFCQIECSSISEYSERIIKSNHLDSGKSCSCSLSLHFDDTGKKKSRQRRCTRRRRIGLVTFQDFGRMVKFRIALAWLICIDLRKHALNSCIFKAYVII